MRTRLDQVLVDRGLCATREQAQRAILAGLVRVNDRPAVKPGDRVGAGDAVQLTAPERFVSRGGHKLEHALQTFALDVSQAVAIDFGASTGGFTDCLLQHGAARVYAVDVGHGQLAWRLRQDPRVVVMERTNARYLTPQSFPGPFHPVDLVVVDCSFISLTKLLAPAAGLLRPGGHLLALIKPQFEAGRSEVDRGQGVIRDPAIHQRVLRELEAHVRQQGQLVWCQVTESPLTGPAGNREFLVLFEKAN
jgi:23S rRNA (cytidine1920-2'-O)/16S rRNA (cytidine1409-2'-O)-methyltransferase